MKIRTVGRILVFGGAFCLLGNAPKQSDPEHFDYSVVIHIKEVSAIGGSEGPFGILPPDVFARVTIDGKAYTTKVVTAPKNDTNRIKPNWKIKSSIGSKVQVTAQISLFEKDRFGSKQYDVTKNQKTKTLDLTLRLGNPKWTVLDSSGVSDLGGSREGDTLKEGGAASPKDKSYWKPAHITFVVTVEKKPKT